MDIRHRLRNRIIRIIQRLSTDKLTEIDKLLIRIERDVSTKYQSLELSGAWKDLESNFFSELADKLHENRRNDRRID